MKRSTVITFAFLASLLSGAAFAEGNEKSEASFSVFWPCAGNGSHCAPRVLVTGSIHSDMDSRFQAFLSQPRTHAHELPPLPTVVFDSPGGSLGGAVALGRLIRKLGFDTEIAPQYSRVGRSIGGQEETFRSNAACASACVLAFAGGLGRSVLPGSRIGVHQFSGAQRAMGDANTQMTVVALAAYLEEMGISRNLLDLASLVPASSIHWLSASETKRLSLDNQVPQLERWHVSPTEEGRPVLEVVQPIAASRVLRVRLFTTMDSVVVVLALVLDKGVLAPARIQQFPASDPPAFQVCGDNRCFEAFSDRPWKIAATEKAHTFTGLAAFSIANFRQLSQARRLAISDNFARALSDVSYSTELSTDGFRAGVALLLR